MQNKSKEEELKDLMKDMEDSGIEIKGVFLNPTKEHNSAEIVEDMINFLKAVKSGEGMELLFSVK